MTSADQILETVIAVSAFGLVLACWAIGVLIWYNKQKQIKEIVDKRLQNTGFTDGKDRVLRLWSDDIETTIRVPGYKRLSFLRRIEQLCREAGLEAPAHIAFMAATMIPLLLFLFLFVYTKNLFLSACVVVGLLLVSWAVLRVRAAKRLSLFELQLIDALELASRSLRAGHPLTGAFQLISDEMPSPVRDVFGDICQLQNMGVNMEEAIRRIAEKSNSNDMKLFATSVVIQLRSGGSLAEMMNRVAFVIRDRIRLHRRLRVIVSQTQMSKRVLMTLPFIMFLLLNILNPDYMSPLYETTLGRSMLLCGAAGLLIGYWAMNRIATIRY
jgi:tight adherence protein B